MKRCLLIILCFILFPCIVFAEEICMDISYDEYCKGSTCLMNLQKSYNTWQNVENTGVSCIKVISEIKGNTRSYLSGKNPEVDYKCSNGASVVAVRVASAIFHEDEVADCRDAACYVPEIWKMDCTSSSQINDDLNNGENLDSDVSINSNGQITGTTDSSETGVETYFIVLFIMLFISYLILTITKKYNFFKSI